MHDDNPKPLQSSLFQLLLTSSTLNPEPDVSSGNTNMYVSNVPVIVPAVASCSGGHYTPLHVIDKGRDEQA